MPRQEPTKPIAFRLSATQERRLKKVAAADGHTLGEFARELVLNKLDEQETLARQVARLESFLSGFHADFANAVEAVMVLMTAKKTFTPEEAKRWVNERIRHLHN